MAAADRDDCAAVGLSVSPLTCKAPTGLSPLSGRLRQPLTLQLVCNKAASQWTAAQSGSQNNTVRGRRLQPPTGVCSSTKWEDANSQFWRLPSCCRMAQNTCLQPTDQLTTCSTVRPEKLTVPQLVKEFPALYRTRRFITTFTTARHLSQSWWCT